MKEKVLIIIFLIFNLLKLKIKSITNLNNIYKHLEEFDY